MDISPFPCLLPWVLQSLDMSSTALSLFWKYWTYLQTISWLLQVLVHFFDTMRCGVLYFCKNNFL